MRVISTLTLLLLAVGTTVTAKEKACGKLIARCKQAGFHPNGHQTKQGLYKDCLIPLRKGLSVPGVKAMPAEIQACKAERPKK